MDFHPVAIAHHNAADCVRVVLSVMWNQRVRLTACANVRRPKKNTTAAMLTTGKVEVEDVLTALTASKVHVEPAADPSNFCVMLADGLQFHKQVQSRECSTGSNAPET